MDELVIFKIIHNKRFNKYLKNFSKFYYELSLYSEQIFFQNENFNENDVKLFEKFIHTFSNYDFEDLKNSFIKLWKESFEEISIEEMKSKIEKINKLYSPEKIFNLINNEEIQMNYDG